MKLFLSSLAVTGRQVSALELLVGKNRADIKMALIENAADLYAENQKGFVLESRATLYATGMQITLLDLLEYSNTSPELLATTLSEYYVIWCGGGNTYYLRWLLKESGFDLVIDDLLAQGIVYGGGSAGAVVAGEDIRFYDVVDSPSMTPSIMYTGLGLTPVAIIPHWENPSIQSDLATIKSNFDVVSREVVCIRDTEAFVVNGPVCTIVSE